MRTVRWRLVAVLASFLPSPGCTECLPIGCPNPLEITITRDGGEPFPEASSYTFALVSAGIDVAQECSFVSHSLCEFETQGPDPMAFVGWTTISGDRKSFVVTVLRAVDAQGESTIGQDSPRLTLSLSVDGALVHEQTLGPTYGRIDLGDRECGVCEFAEQSVVVGELRPLGS